MRNFPRQAAVTVRRGSLYKYKSLKGLGLEQVKEILCESMIYCPRPDQLNDDRECKPLMTIGDIADPEYRPKVHAWVRRCVGHRVPSPAEDEILVELAQLTQTSLQALIDKATLQYQKEINDRYRILSLADSPKNHHLWSNYADNYRGVCLEFFVDPLFGSAFQVQYRDAIPAFDLTDNEALDTLIETVLIKRTKWKKEREYRLILADPPPPNDPLLINQRLMFPPSQLTAIILGHKILADDRKALLSMARQRNPQPLCLTAYQSVCGPILRPA